MTIRMVYWGVFVIFCVALSAAQVNKEDDDVNLEHSCMDKNNNPQACYPPFMSAAAGRRVNASNTCGMDNKKEKYCYLLPSTSQTPHCAYCLKDRPGEDHSPDTMTDNDNSNWWQSQTLADNKIIHFQNSVNLTVDLGTRMHLAYLYLKFVSPPPNAMAIYRRRDLGSDWEPWAYFSSNCLNYFNMKPNNDFENFKSFDEVVCSEAYAVPQDNVVSFSVTKGRVKPDKFYLFKKYKDWALAREVRFEFRKMFTMGDERDAEEATLLTYYIAVSQMRIGGRCDCNGHGNYCRQSTGAGEPTLVCECHPSHHTEGDNCERCQSGYMDIPWKAADRNNPFACKHLQKMSRTNGKFKSVTEELDEPNRGYYQALEVKHKKSY